MKLKVETTKIRRIPVKLKNLKGIYRCLKVTVKYQKKTRINVHFIRCKKMVRFLGVVLTLNQLKRRNKSNHKEDVHLCPVKRKRILL